MSELKIEKVLYSVRSLGFEAQIQKETEQVYLILKIEGVDFPLFIRILESGPILQFIAFLPCKVSEKTVYELSRVLHFFNKEMDIPGFGIDEKAAVVFYRFTLPSFDQKIDNKELETLLKSIELVCHSFTPMIINVVNGTMTYNSILKVVEKQLNQ